MAPDWNAIIWFVIWAFVILVVLGIAAWAIIASFFIRAHNKATKRIFRDVRPDFKASGFPRR